MFRVGYWWFNFVCVYWDGIIGSVCEIFIKGWYDYVVFLFMIGCEDVYWNKVKYFCCGKLVDMYIFFMSWVGKEICVLWGLGFFSFFVFKVGVCYDGKYELR